MCTGAVRGVLAYVGFAGILTTELFQRMVCMFRPLPPTLHLPSLAPTPESETMVVSFWRVHCFTVLQVACTDHPSVDMLMNGGLLMTTCVQVCILVLFWTLNLSPQPAALLVAFAVAALGPVRLHVLPCFFSAEELALLDL